MTLLAEGVPLPHHPETGRWEDAVAQFPHLSPDRVMMTLWRSFPALPPAGELPLSVKGALQQQDQVGVVRSSACSQTGSSTAKPAIATVISAHRHATGRERWNAAR